MIALGKIDIWVFFFFPRKTKQHLNTIQRKCHGKHYWGLSFFLLNYFLSLILYSVSLFSNFFNFFSRILMGLHYRLVFASHWSHCHKYSKYQVDGLSMQYAYQMILINSIVDIFVNLLQVDESNMERLN